MSKQAAGKPVDAAGRLRVGLLALLLGCSPLVAQPDDSLRQATSAASITLLDWQQQLSWQFTAMPQRQQTARQWRCQPKLSLGFGEFWQLDAGLTMLTPVASIGADHPATVQRSPDWAGWSGQPVPARGWLDKLQLQYSDGQSVFRVGRQLIDWRVTDTVSVADVWTVADWQQLPAPAQQAQPALRWLWGQASSGQLDLVASARSATVWLPAGLWQAPLPADYQLPAVSRAPQQTQLGARWSAQYQQLRWHLLHYDGSDYQPVLAPASADHWLYPRQQVSALQGEAEWGGVIWRAELGLVRQQLALLPDKHSEPAVWRQQYAQYVLSAQYEWFGEQAQTLLLLQYSQETAPQGTPWPQWYPDLGRVFAGQWLGRLQYDPSGDLQQQWQLEWAWQRAAEASFIKARHTRRLADNWQLQLGYQGFHGEASHWWGRYKQHDSWQLELTWLW